MYFTSLHTHTTQKPRWPEIRVPLKVEICQMTFLYFFSFIFIVHVKSGRIESLQSLENKDRDEVLSSSGVPLDTSSLGLSEGQLPHSLNRIGLMLIAILPNPKLVVKIK